MMDVLNSWLLLLSWKTIPCFHFFEINDGTYEYLFVLSRSVYTMLEIHRRWRTTQTTRPTQLDGWRPGNTLQYRYVYTRKNPELEHWYVSIGSFSPASANWRTCRRIVLRDLLLTKTHTLIINFMIISYNLVTLLHWLMARKEKLDIIFEAKIAAFFSSSTHPVFDSVNEWIIFSRILLIEIWIVITLLYNSQYVKTWFGFL